MQSEETLGIRSKSQRNKLASGSGRNRKMFLEFFYLNLKAIRQKGTTISV